MKSVTIEFYGNFKLKGINCCGLGEKWTPNSLQFCLYEEHLFCFGSFSPFIIIRNETCFYHSFVCFLFPPGVGSSKSQILWVDKRKIQVSYCLLSVYWTFKDGLLFSIYSIYLLIHIPLDQ